MGVCVYQTVVKREEMGVIARPMRLYMEAIETVIIGEWEMKMLINSMGYKLCKGCQKWINKEAKYCGICGKKQEGLLKKVDDSSVIIYTICGGCKEKVVHSNYCGYCGYKLR